MHDIMPLTGMTIQLHRPVRQTFFLLFLPGRNCLDFTCCSVIIIPSFRMKAFGHCTFNFIGRWINFMHVLSAAVRGITDVIDWLITIVANA
jgi:hypothetical protein